MSSGQKAYAEEQEEQAYQARVAVLAKVSPAQLDRFLKEIEQGLRPFSPESRLTHLEHAGIARMKQALQNLLKG